MADLITGGECIALFEELGVKMTKTRFSKQKSKGFYKVYKKEGSNRDYFIWDEVVKAFFDQTISQNMEEDRARAEYKRRQKVKKKKMEMLEKIEEQLDIIHGFQTLKPEMFNIENLHKSAQENLEELKRLEEEIPEPHRAFIRQQAAKSNEDHIADFEKSVYVENQISATIRDLSEAIREDLSEIYPDFKGSSFEFNLLKVIADWISSSQDPKEFADSFGIDLVEK